MIINKKQKNLRAKNLSNCAAAAATHTHKQHTHRQTPRRRKQSKKTYFVSPYNIVNFLNLSTGRQIGVLFICN